MLRHNNELKADIFVVTKENYVVTRKAAVRDFCHDREIFCRDRKWKISGRSQGKFVATRDSMLQQKVQPTTRSKEDFIEIWKEFVETQGSVSAIQGNTTLL